MFRTIKYYWDLLHITIIVFPIAYKSYSSLQNFYPVSLIKRPLNLLWHLKREIERCRVVKVSKEEIDQCIKDMKYYNGFSRHFNQYYPDKIHDDNEFVNEMKILTGAKSKRQ